MAWMKVESSVARHRKFVQAGPAASWLWLCGNAYCQEGLTDGFIPCEALEYLGVKQPRRLVPALVRAGLWDDVDGGWRVHDYLDHNKTADEVQRIRSERRAAGARGGVASGEARSKRTGEANPEANPEQIASDSAKQPAKHLASDGLKQPANQSVLDGSKQTKQPANQSASDCLKQTKQTANPSTATATATTTAGEARAPARDHAPLHDRSHRTHAHCGRVCLHASQFDEFVRRRNHPDADREIRDWALTVEREWGPAGPRAREEPGDPFAFWKARYAEQWPATAPVPPSAPSAAEREQRRNTAKYARPGP